MEQKHTHFKDRNVNSLYIRIVQQSMVALLTFLTGLTPAGVRVCDGPGWGLGGGL